MIQAGECVYNWCGAGQSWL